MNSQTPPKPPYWTVIFTNQRTRVDPQAYKEAAARMIELVRHQPGCLGFDSARDENGFGITISYWDSLDAIKSWRDHPEHLTAQALGKEKWYAKYDLHIARVERAYHFKAPLKND